LPFFNDLLETLFDLSMPGKYAMTVATTSFFGGLTTQSQQLSFEILEPQKCQQQCALSSSSQPLVALINKTVYKQSAPIRMDVRFANLPTSNTATAKTPVETIKVLKPVWAERFYEVMVEGPGENKKVPLTRYGDSILDADAKTTSASAAQKITVPQGSEVSHALWLNRIFDMTVPGDYQVWAKSSATDSAGKTEEFVSEKIKITVQGDGVNR
jgi:hypothetical protein